MKTDEAVALRKALERELMTLLQKYRDATGLTPISVDVQTVDITPVGRDRSIALTGGRVTVEL
jgi:hypothetical protein